MMKKKTTFLFLLVIGLAGIGMSQAGDLEPPGSPAPTMVTLQEIYDRFDELEVAVLGVQETGQTACWDTAGNPIGCAGTGQDGEYQAGVSVDPRFTNNGDGTVTDNLTGLIWLQDASCFGFQNWTDALSNANLLASASDTCTPDLTDESLAGDWRLPNLKELQSLIDYGQYNPVLPPGHPFSGVQSNVYWSSTSDASVPDGAWGVRLDFGRVNDSGKPNTNYVWPVRGGR